MHRSVACISGALRDDIQGVDLPAWFLYPTEGAESVQQFGPYSFEVALDGPPLGSDWPLVVISHGNNGTPWSHRDTARALVRAGYAVVLVEHLGNSRSDQRLADTPENLANRPRHVRLALDWALGHFSVSKTSVFGIGHSIGSYTLLAAAGGEPSMSYGPGRIGARVHVVHEPRLRALVLLAPASPWFIPAGSLRNVTVPILLRRGELDALTPAFHSELILAGVPNAAKVDYAVVPGAGHFSFQSPFPASMTRPDFPPSQDPPGFDRAAFQPKLNAEIVSFLDRGVVSDATGSRRRLRAQ